MKLEHEDPRVIDYVLGELPEDERAAIRAALAETENAEAAAFARELGGVSLLSVATLQAEAKADAAQAESPAPERQYRPERNWSPWNPSVVRFMKGLTFATMLVILPFLAMNFLLPRVGGERVLTGLNQMSNVGESRNLKQVQSQDMQAVSSAGPDNFEDLPTATITRGAAVGGGVVAPAPPAAPAPPVAEAPESAPAESWDFSSIDLSAATSYSANYNISGASTVNAPKLAESEEVSRMIQETLPKQAKAEPAPAAAAPHPGLQNLEVAGEIRIRGNSYDFDEKLKDVAFVEQRTRLNFKPETADDPGMNRQLAELGYGITDSDGEAIQNNDIHALIEGNGGGGFGGGTPRPALQLTLPVAFKSVLAEPLSTFAADVDTASYTLIRRDLQGGQLPAPQRVRTEEFINYFDYAYPEPTGEHPFSVTVDVAACPWAPTHRLARVGIKGKAMDARERVAANLVFLVDVSGSMDSPDKLPLVRESLRGLLETLKESDRVALVTYAGESRVVLEPTSCEQKDKIRAAIDSLGAGGSTNGAGGITAAYEQARRAFIEKGINRVLIATDGDFNVGVTSQQELERLITQQAKSGVFLSLLGYGTGNLNDTTLETLADKGNGFYAYIDDIGEARRVLVEKGLSAIATIAKDVKFQIEFNPAKVGHYRQIGYENRQLAAQDFNDDTKDAGDIGPGHTVTALYELVPAGQSPTPGVDPLKYQQTEPAPVANNNPESMTVKLRYKQPDAQTSQLLEVPVLDSGTAFDAAPQDFQFASAVAAFAQVLKGLQLAQPPTLEQIRAIADATKANDPARQEFVDLVVTTKTLVR